MSRTPRSLSRRKLLQGTAAVAGTYAASRLTGNGLVGRAQAQLAGEKSALLLIILEGGYNALFGSADSFLNTSFGVTGTNTRNLGNGLVIDAPTFGTLPQVALDRMAQIGVRHGITDHGAAQRSNVTVNNQSAPIRLAASMGGDASIKAAVLGNMIAGTHNAIDGVSLQRITDTRSTINALGGGTPDPTVPDRRIATAGLTAGMALSRSDMTVNQQALRSMSEGFPTVIETLSAPVKPFDYAAMAQAYGVAANDTAVNSFTKQMLGAELMIQAGANVVVAENGGWDTHGDRSGATVRNRMTGTILPGLRTFLNRTLNMPGYNVVTAIIGDFSRSLPGSDHAAVLSATVFGKYVRLGTTGRVNANVTLPAGTPTIPGFWAYLAAVTKTPGAPFGDNPHNLVL